MSYVYTVLGFMALIVLHEAGHFLAAKATGMRVERFSLFFGKPLVSVRRGETEYGIGWLPAGGYVKITGMNPQDELGLEDELRELRERLPADDADEPALGPGAQEPTAPGGEAGTASALSAASVERAELDSRIASMQAELQEIRHRAYYNQKVWKRIVVILAGPFMNLVIAFLVLFAIFATHPVYVYDSHGNPEISRVVGAVQRGAPAAGRLRPGDVIVAVDGHRIRSFSQVERLVNAHRCPGAQVGGCRAATPVRIEVERHGRLVTLRVRPVYDASLKRMLVGFEFAQRSRRLGIPAAAGHSFTQIGTVTGKTVSAIGRIFEPKERRQLHGVVGVVAITSQEFSFSTVDALGTLALISLSLAIVNLFPFLPLDGGHVFWALAEKVRGRRISFQTMERAGVVGFALIVVLFAIGLSNDISSLTGNGFNLR
jgi:regulator of sigma E protease